MGLVGLVGAGVYLQHKPGSTDKKMAGANAELEASETEQAWDQVVHYDLEENVSSH